MTCLRIETETGCLIIDNDSITEYDTDGRMLWRLADGADGATITFPEPPKRAVELFGGRFRFEGTL